MKFIFFPTLITCLLCYSFILFADNSTKENPNTQKEQSQEITFLRRVKNPENHRLTLQTAIVKYTPKNLKGPSIYLVGVTHIGDAQYYKQLQAFLEESTLVLWEGISGEPFQGVIPKNEKEQIIWTWSAMNYLGLAVQYYQKQHQKFPKSIEDIRQMECQKQGDFNKSAILKATQDAWENDFIFEFDNKNKKFFIISLGADNQKGGTEIQADLLFDITKSFGELGKDHGGIQQEMADMLNLTFQLDQIDYDRDHFLHSDISLKKLSAEINGNTYSIEDEYNDWKKLISQGHNSNKQLIENSEDNAQQLFSVLSGNNFAISLGSKLVKNLLNVYPKYKEIIKIVMIDALTTKDIVEMGIQNFPNGERLLTALLDYRNKAVFNDLSQIIPSMRNDESISIFYGAAHLNGMHQILTEQMNYIPVETKWLNAILADPQKAGISQSEIRLIRKQVQSALMKELKKSKKSKKNSQDKQ